MTRQHQNTDRQMIPVDQIAVLNPRDRNGRVFEEIVGNIKSIGLKKPVTVTPRDGLEDGKRFLLICGEGRLKAFRSLGEKEIPALVVAVNDEDAFIMSLTENIARRKYSALELLMSIQQLSEQGYDKRVIAQKTGLSLDYIKGILLLFEKGEERLLAAVESGRVPLNVAITIAGASDEESVQTALQDAYESGQLRGGQLMQVRRVLQRRSTLGKTLKHRPARLHPCPRPRQPGSPSTARSPARSAARVHAWGPGPAPVPPAARRLATPGRRFATGIRP